MLVSLTHSRWMPKWTPLFAGSSGNIHFMPSDSVYSTVATCKPPNVGPTHCNLLISTRVTIPVCYIHSVTQGMVPGMDIKKRQYTDLVFWYWHVEKAVCKNRTWHKQYIHIVSGTAVSQTSWLQQNLPWCRTRLQKVTSVNKWQILKGLVAKGKQIICSACLNTLTHALIAPYDWSWRINCTFLFIKSSSSSCQ